MPGVLIRASPCVNLPVLDHMSELRENGCTLPVRTSSLFLRDLPNRDTALVVTTYEEL